MNSSAFKANVHLNIVSYASLFSYIFVIREDKLFLSDRVSSAQSVVEVHFVKMQTFEQKVRLSNVCFFFFFFSCSSSFFVFFYLFIFIFYNRAPVRHTSGFCVLARRLSKRLSTGLQ